MASSLGAAQNNFTLTAMGAVAQNVPPTHLDVCRACSKRRPEESGRGRVCWARANLFLRGPT